MQTNFDALFARDESREQEYLAIRGQIAQLEAVEAHQVDGLAHDYWNHSRWRCC